MERIGGQPRAEHAREQHVAHEAEDAADQRQPADRPDVSDQTAQGARRLERVRGCSETFVIASGAKQSRSEEHTSELQSLMRISYAVFCLKKKIKKNTKDII